MTPTLELGEFGLTQQSLLAALLTQIRCEEDELLLACGSIVEGLGNSRSDLDMVLITPRGPKQIESAGNRVVVVGPLICDILLVHPDAIRALNNALVALTGPARDTCSAAKGMSELEQTFLHRLRNAVPVAPGAHMEAAYDRLRRRISSKRLSLQKLNRACHQANALQLDLAGLRDVGEWASMIFVAQELLGWTLDALLAAHGSTNATPKWRAKLLERLPSDWCEDISGVAPGSSPTSLLLRLNAAPDRIAAAAISQYALRIASFSRAVFVAAERRLFQLGEPLINLALARNVSEPLGDRLPALDLDVCLRAREQGYELFRLNDPLARLGLSRDLASLLCFFDGETSVWQAHCAATEVFGSTLGGNLVDSLSALISGAQLTAPFCFDEGALRDAVAAAVRSSEQPTRKGE